MLTHLPEQMVMDAEVTDEIVLALPKMASKVIGAAGQIAYREACVYRRASKAALGGVDACGRDVNSIDESDPMTCKSPGNATIVAASIKEACAIGKAKDLI